MTQNISTSSTDYLSKITEYPRLEKDMCVDCKMRRWFYLFTKMMLCEGSLVGNWTTL